MDTDENEFFSLSSQKEERAGVRSQILVRSGSRGFEN
jgi:hypothetical protein